jgi:hypothetical protein
MMVILEETKNGQINRGSDRLENYGLQYSPTPLVDFEDQGEVELPSCFDCSIKPIN